jgi:tetratricopeptide (TPR) repeat protein
MTDWHPSTRSLELFMGGEMNSTESRDLVLHLLSGCSNCREIAGSFAPGCSRSGRASGQVAKLAVASNHSEERYDAVFERVLPRVWETEISILNEAAAAQNLLEELLRHPHERRMLIIRNSGRFQSLALCEAILESAQGGGKANSDEALDLVDLAIVLADSLSANRYGEALIKDLQARAYGSLGSARRIRSDFVGAQEALDTAESLLEVGSGDELVQAKLLSFRGALLADQQRFDQAFVALDKAISIYRRLGQRDEEARVQMVKGMHLGNAGFPDRAVKHLRLGLKLVDPSENPRLELVGKHNLIDNLYRSGRYHQALVMVPETRNLHRKLGNATDLAKFEWLEALIARESGESERAEATFVKIKGFFLAKGWPHEVALVSLDLSMLLLRQGRARELQDVAAEMLVIFRGLRIDRQTIAALVLFQKAVQMERATVGLVRDLAAYLKSSRHHPNLPFRPSTNA